MLHSPPTPAFADLQRNLDYAKRLVEGGKLLSGLGVGSFDVDDLYRAAWVQAVAAIDHWVHEEIYHRAPVIAQQSETAKPRKFLDIQVSMKLFEAVHLGTTSLEVAFRSHLKEALGWRSYQNPNKIREGFAMVSDVQLWPEVAKVLSSDDPDGEKIRHEHVIDEISTIVNRRNKISHEADRDPDRSGQKIPIDADTTYSVIERLEQVARAILVALDGPVQALPPSPETEQIDPELIEETPGDAAEHEARFFAQVADANGRQTATAVRTLLDWWRERGGDTQFSQAASPSCALTIRRGKQSLNMVRLYTTTVEVPFGTLKNRRPFDNPEFREELRQRLNEAPGIDIPATRLELYPTFKIAELTEPDVYNTVVESLIWFSDSVHDPANR
ncbi:hypothetical protein GCM10023193_56430 [Planotetraspora kaengkrachanensis]|uniref:RiboL-PSP-HEPN domain-containing protein n=1 Tax=Planotetraspora kaengkrachanensis TaxID=575193 RepID=A0A8J3V6X7_9ACTN|nr:hypothetical protein Pka01_45290 [Planotetraspora kaengkrachanensis]